MLSSTAKASHDRLLHQLHRSRPRLGRVDRLGSGGGGSFRAYPGVGFPPGQQLRGRDAQGGGRRRAYACGPLSGLPGLRLRHGRVGRGLCQGPDRREGDTSPGRRPEGGSRRSPRPDRPHRADRPGRSRRAGEAAGRSRPRPGEADGEAYLPRRPPPPVSSRRSRRLAVGRDPHP